MKRPWFSFVLALTVFLNFLCVLLLQSVKTMKNDVKTATASAAPEP